MKIEIYKHPTEDFIWGIIAYDPNCTDCRGSYMKTDYIQERKKVEALKCVYSCTIDLSALAPNDMEGPYFPGEVIYRLTERGCSKKELYDVLELTRKDYTKIISAAQSGLKVLDEIEESAEK